ncbi:hypothetical protein ACOME3_008795 [Neoechinorhynchus agilis]
MFVANARDKLKRCAHRSTDLDDHDGQKEQSFLTATNLLLLKPVITLTEDEALRRSHAIVTHFQHVLDDPGMLARPECLRFIEVSLFSFRNNEGLTKLKEGAVKKRCGGYSRWFLSLKSLCNLIFRWRSCWLLIGDSYIAYVHPKSGEIRGVMLFDDRFKCTQCMSWKKSKSGLMLQNASRSLTIVCSNHRRCTDFRESILNAAEKSEYFCASNRFKSFAPVRQNVNIKWLVDGASYFEAMADMIIKAKEEIFITDWFLSPELHLKRPALDNQWRLDNLLRSKAEEGVRIYVLLYKEVDFVLGTNSAYSKKKLMNSHSNIKVLRYPDHRNPVRSTVLWANHEKILIIDQSIAFFGGFDICYGRWDDCTHRLSDLGTPGASDLFTNAVTTSNATSNQKTHKNRTSKPLKLADNQIMSAPWSTVCSKQIDITPSCIDKYLKQSIPDYIDGNNKKMRDNNACDADLDERTEKVQPQRSLSCHPFLTSTDKKRLARLRARTISLDSVDYESPIVDKRSVLLASGIDCIRTCIGRGSRHRNSFSHGLGEHASMCLSLDSGIAYISITESLNQLDRPARVSIRRRIREKLKYIPRLNFLHPVLYNQTGEHPSDVSSPTMHGQQRPCSSQHRKRAFERQLAAFGELVLEKFVHPNGLRLWPGKDYSNIVLKDFRSVDTPFEDSIDRATLPRMPWHDVGGVVSGKAAQDIARHFIQRWNFVKVLKFKTDHVYPLLLPRSSSRSRARIDIDDLHPQKCQVQVLRSVCKWSAGVGHVWRRIEWLWWKLEGWVRTNATPTKINRLWTQIQPCIVNFIYT